ncbi:MAG: helix-turn-helix domain-containing protein [Xanthobacteraceae bacterium]|nr:helix-turn-helix domain-containing protein [Xanthobacteraceae bacterium]
MPAAKKIPGKLRLGSFLKEVRSSRGVSLRDVERITNGRVSNGYLSQLETGRIVNPSVATLQFLSAAYGIDPMTLMERAGFSPTTSTRGSSSNSALGDLTDDEEEQLLRYLAFIRSR